IEGDEARVVLEEVPELLQDLLLAAGDVRARSGLVDAQVGPSWNLVQRAGAPVLDIDHADGHDAPAKRREPSRTTRLLGVTLGETFDQIFADVRVMLFPRNADRLDVDDEFFHGWGSWSF